MIVGIIGSRNIKNYKNEEIFDILEKNIPENTSLIISGGAKGIDTLGIDYAKSKKINFEIFKPDYKKYGKVAPLKRNIKIIERCDFVVAVWNQKSSGTLYVLDNLIKTNKPFKIITLN